MQQVNLDNQFTFAISSILAKEGPKYELLWEKIWCY